MRSKKAIYNISLLLLLQVVVIIYGFIVPKIIIKTYGSNVNGLISSITQFLSYIALLESGIGPVIKAALYKPIAEKDKKSIANILKSSEKFFRRIALIFIVYLFILMIVYPLIVKTSFNFIYTSSLILVISISTFAEYFFGMTYRLYLQADQKSYITSIIQILTYLVSIIIIVVLVKLNMSIHVIKFFSGLVFVLRPLFQNYYVKKKYKINFKDADDKYKLEQKWDGLSQHVAGIVHNNTDIIILTFFRNLVEVSIYSVYYLVIKGIKSIVQVFSDGIVSSFGDMIAKNEKENLNDKFSIYEVIYYTLITIIYSCSIILIVPFIKVYTLGITDANYIRKLFGCLLVISEFVCSIRLPYISLAYAAGHFKETRKGAWVEAFSNITISLILVKRFGIVGVTIGTLVAMSIRTIEFVYHTNKYILERNIFNSIKKIILIVIETVLVVLITKLIIPTINVNSYLDWIIYALIVAGISIITTFGINFICYNKQIKSTIKIMKGIFKKKKLQ